MRTTGMTLEHSDLQKLVENLAEILERYRTDPAALEAVLSELKALYQKIPIYPGIIADCLPEVVKPAEVGKLKKGDEVTLLLKGDKVLAGRVSGTDSGQLKLEKCQQFDAPKSRSEATVPIDDIQEARLFTREVLSKKWPSLDFEE